MKMRTSVIILINILYSAQSHVLNPNVIRDYFKLKSIDRITIISCMSSGMGAVRNFIFHHSFSGEAAKFVKKIQYDDFIFSFNFKSLDEGFMRRQGAVMDLSCPNLENVISEISNKRMFNVGKEWLIFCGKLDEPTIFEESIKILNDSFILPGSSVIIAHQNGSTLNYYDIYKITSNHPFKTKFLGNGNPEEIEFFRKGGDRSNFENATLRSASVLRRPELFKGFYDTDQVEIDTWAKMHYPLAVNMAEMLNFTFTLTFSNDYGWLNKENGSFSGLFGKFQRNEIDFAALGCFVRHDRLDLADFTIVTYTLKSMIIFKQPPLSSVSNIFLLPFTRVVWISCGALSLLVIILLLIEIFILKKINSESFSNSITFFDVVTIVFGFVCQQGTNLIPISISSRIIIFIFSLSALFFYTSYSANIVALLQSTSPVLKNLTDLTNSRLALKLQNRDYNEIILKDTNDPAVKEIHEKKILPFGMKAYIPPREGVKLLRTGKVAFQVEVNLGYKIIEETFSEGEKCGLGEIRLLFIPGLAFPVLKNNGLRELFTQKFIWQREAGMVDKIAKIWIPPRPKCEGKAKGFSRVGMIDFLPALLSLLYGTLIAISILLLELVYNYRSRYFHFITGKETPSPLFVKRA